MFIPATNKKFQWQDFTLILPTVSVGNVGQLATDLIVSTLWMERIGYIVHSSLLPTVGNNPFAHEDATSCKLTTCCEVYESISAQMVVIQQRAPLVKGRKKEYINWLSSWIKNSNFYQVVILTSSFSQERLDHQIVSSPFRILKSPKMEESAGEFFRTKMGWKELERRQMFPAPAGQGSQQSSDQSQLLYMPGSGIAKDLFENCERESVDQYEWSIQRAVQRQRWIDRWWGHDCYRLEETYNTQPDQNLPILVLMMFVSEGDNAPDALSMADQLNAWLNLIVKKEEEDKSQSEKRVESKDVAKGISKWKIPMSWKLVYGSNFDQKLFR